MLMPIVDRLTYVFWVRPDEPLSIEVIRLAGEGKWFRALKVLGERRREQVKLSLNNVLFMMAWVVVATFLLTSSRSPMSMGLVLGVGWGVLFDIYTDWKRRDYLILRLFWPVRRVVGWAETKRVILAMGVAFGIVTLLSI